MWPLSDMKDSYKMSKQWQKLVTIMVKLLNPAVHKFCDLCVQYRTAHGMFCCDHDHSKPATILPTTKSLTSRIWSTHLSPLVLQQTFDKPCVCLQQWNTWQQMSPGNMMLWPWASSSWCFIKDCSAWTNLQGQAASPWKWRQYDPLKYQELLVQGRSITSQMICTFSNNTVRISHVTRNTLYAIQV
jgi:hypothetical protein